MNPCGLATQLNIILDGSSSLSGLEHSQGTPVWGFCYCDVILCGSFRILAGSAILVLDATLCKAHYDAQDASSSLLCCLCLHRSHSQYGPRRLRALHLRDAYDSTIAACSLISSSRLPRSVPVALRLCRLRVSTDCETFVPLSAWLVSQRASCAAHTLALDVTRRE
ncbi:hypothetical protein DFH08DRAFT_440166 [Mycena albidolilacea]|uniref:Uncharacterized protein n=1 Tax=Mycena albidolilacea TaxID=1033008 RepID=A0AAD7F0L0_9AGAR|nr:hypothetical protein DFH08DRAFT_440166 [Mycena albidolilacea]